mmetsp:Transcript_4298/g.8876  ORF Transcript_4298/g.8876 Transcript_4298/m.8876 type:complete len:264 (+) Transcript_4298:275-1066(+)
MGIGRLWGTSSLQRSSTCAISAIVFQSQRRALRKRCFRSTPGRMCIVIAAQSLCLEPSTFDRVTGQKLLTCSARSPPASPEAGTIARPAAKNTLPKGSVPSRSWMTCPASRFPTPSVAGLREGTGRSTSECCRLLQPDCLMSRWLSTGFPHHCLGFFPSSRTSLAAPVLRTAEASVHVDLLADRPDQRLGNPSPGPAPSEGPASSLGFWSADCCSSLYCFRSAEAFARPVLHWQLYKLKVTVVCLSGLAYHSVSMHVGTVVKT